MKYDLERKIIDDGNIHYPNGEHRQYKFTSTGIIQYDPYRGNMGAKWWCVVNCDNGISDYYRSEIQKRYGIKVYPPAWGAHISIIRGEKPAKDKMHLWKKYHKEKLEFQYTHDVFFDGNFWWLNVYAPELKMIRDEFGFPSDWGHHLTVGRMEG